MRYLFLSAVCVAATESNATLGALADRVEWSRVNNKTSYDWPNSTQAATPFDGVVVLPIGESTARGLSEGALRHEVTNPYHFHDAGRLFVLEMLLNAFAIATNLV